MDTQRDRESRGDGEWKNLEMRGRRCSDLHIGILTELDAGKYSRATQFYHVDEALTAFVFFFLPLPSLTSPYFTVYFQSKAHSFKTDFISC